MVDIEKLVEDTKRLILKRMEPGFLHAPSQVITEWGIGFTEFQEASEQLAAEGLIRVMEVHKPKPGRTKAYFMLTEKGRLRK